jgi:glycosyltransferase involved in cell wall biosynthesis
MKIYHVITRLIIGGAQENTVLTCEGLHQHGHDVSLLIGPETGPEGSLLKRARTGGYRLIEAESLRRNIDVRRDWRALNELTTLLRAAEPDLVHTHSSKAGILARIAAKRAGVPIIVHTIHGMSFNRTQPWLVRKLYAGMERYCAGFTDRLITVADAMTEQSLAAGIGTREQFTTIYSGMQTEWFSPDQHDRAACRAAVGLDPDDIAVACVARLFRNKGYEQLIPAMDMAIRQEPRLRFVWIGDGPDAEAYQQELRRRGIRDRVILTGLLPPDQVAGALAAADMLVHASQWEGLPRAVVQALLMEKPVVSFAIDGAPEVVLPGETGILVALNDADGLARAMLDLAANEETRRSFGRAGRELCLQRFDWREMVGRIEEVYNELADQRLDR